MTFSGKNLLKAFICLILLTLGFGVLFSNIIIGFLIGAFVSISMFFDPSKMEKAKKREERKLAKALEEKNAIAEQELREKEIDNLDLNNIEGYDDDDTNK